MPRTSRPACHCGRRAPRRASKPVAGLDYYAFSVSSGAPQASRGSVADSPRVWTVLYQGQPLVPTSYSRGDTLRVWRKAAGPKAELADVPVWDGDKGKYVTWDQAVAEDRRLVEAHAEDIAKWARRGVRVLRGRRVEAPVVELEPGGNYIVVGSDAARFKLAQQLRAAGPYRRVHNTSSTAALVGPSKYPSEVELARGGTLWLERDDKFDPFSRSGQEALVAAKQQGASLRYVMPAESLKDAAFVQAHHHKGALGRLHWKIVRLPK